MELVWFLWLRRQVKPLICLRITVAPKFMTMTWLLRPVSADLCNEHRSYFSHRGIHCHELGLDACLTCTVAHDSEVPHRMSHENEIMLSLSCHRLATPPRWPPLNTNQMVLRPRPKTSLHWMWKPTKRKSRCAHLAWQLYMCCCC